jgi:hypothetical protein
MNVCSMAKLKGKPDRLAGNVALELVKSVLMEYDYQKMLSDENLVLILVYFCPWMSLKVDGKV